MYTPPATRVPASHESIPSQESLLSPEWVHAITNRMGFPLTSETGQELQKWVLYQSYFDHTGLVVTWDPIEFEENRNLQRYPEPDGTFSYLQPNPVKQLVGLRNYMLVLMDKRRPTDQHQNTFYYLLDEQWTDLTANDIRSALAKEVLKNHSTQTFPRTPRSNSTYPSSYASMRPSIHWEHASFEKGLIQDDPPQDVDKFHPCVSCSTTTNLNDTCPLDTSYEHPLHLDSPNLSSEIQDN